MHGVCASQHRTSFPADVVLLQGIVYENEDPMFTTMPGYNNAIKVWCVRCHAV